MKYEILYISYTKILLQIFQSEIQNFLYFTYVNMDTGLSAWNM